LVARQAHNLEVEGSSPSPATRFVNMSDTKFKQVYRSDYTTCTWYYDYSIFKNGPICVEIEYHDGLVEIEPKVRKTKVKKPKAVKPKAKPKAKPKTKAPAKPKREKVDKNVSKWFDV
jgi:hypothetical protein